MPDESCFGEFYFHPVRMGVKSEQQGREIFEDVEFVRILIPGDNKTVVEREAKDADRIRFKNAYDAWKRSGEIAQDGTPLEQWPVMSPARIRELKALNFFTVEHVASMTETAMQKVGMGARELSVKAKAFLEAAKGSAAAQGYATENEHLKTDVERLTRQVEELGIQLTALTKKEAA